MDLLHLRRKFQHWLLIISEPRITEGWFWSYFVGNLLIYLDQKEKIIQTNSISYNSSLSVISQGWKRGRRKGGGGGGGGVTNYTFVIRTNGRNLILILEMNLLTPNPYGTIQKLSEKSIRWSNFIKIWNFWPPSDPPPWKIVFRALPSYFSPDLKEKGVKMLRASHSIIYWAVQRSLTHCFYLAYIQGD